MGKFVCGLVLISAIVSCNEKVCKEYTLCYFKQGNENPLYYNTVLISLKGDHIRQINYYGIFNFEDSVKVNFSCPDSSSYQDRGAYSFYRRTIQDERSFYGFQFRKDTVKSLYWDDTPIFSLTDQDDTSQYIGRAIYDTIFDDSIKETKCLKYTIHHEDYWTPIGRTDLYFSLDEFFFIQIEDWSLDNRRIGINKVISVKNIRQSYFEDIWKKSRKMMLPTGKYYLYQGI